jgi:hypothetical protein
LEARWWEPQIATISNSQRFRQNGRLGCLLAVDQRADDLGQGLLLLGRRLCQSRRPSGIVTMLLHLISTRDKTRSTSILRDVTDRGRADPVGQRQVTHTIFALPCRRLSRRYPAPHRPAYLQQSGNSPASHHMPDCFRKSMATSATGRCPASTL